MCCIFVPAIKRKKKIEIMTTLKFTFETTQELQNKKIELQSIYGKENVTCTYGTFEKYNYNVNFNIFN